ncbi:MAG: cobyric acid synthase [Deltaproteobacteria bacterium]|nr:cobyric acid synthase [Deltaproteobacteria bacterium]
MLYRPLMILGAGSDVGKTLLAAALCRIFRQDGVRVAPFKAQNMALNSFITPAGGEMGRAQVLQAQAAGLTPHVDMNPILLKPSRGVGCQVIVQGKVYGNLTSAEYYRRKPALMRTVMACFRRLAAAHELIILEGAGSAVELNLRRSDLVNFAMAKKAGAAALLVADIDRGGVFAATIGSFNLLTPGQRRLLAGFIINKFRGDPALFAEGVKIIEKRTRRPVLGVVPYLADLALPEEDSVPLDRQRSTCGQPAKKGVLNIGVIRLPHISNYTDFGPLKQEPKVHLRYLDAAESLDGLDVLILPGTKSTISDLVFLKHKGMADKIQAFAESGGHIVGICGGYQMLGLEVRDPVGVEGEPGAEAGLGLLPIVTTMAGTKTTTQVAGEALGAPGAGLPVTGYEIHMGVTEIQGPGQPALAVTERNGQPVRLTDGWVAPNGRVWGAYVHGLFDNDAFRRAFLDKVSRERGVARSDNSDLSWQSFQEEQLDRLAQTVRRHLDMEKIRALLSQAF